jgi:hypothetical protein
MKKTRPTKDQKKQLKTLDALRDADIDLSDIPDQGNKTGWVRGLMHRPATRAISIRLAAPDKALAHGAVTPARAVLPKSKLSYWRFQPLTAILRKTLLPGMFYSCVREGSALQRWFTFRGMSVKASVPLIFHN